MVNINSFGNESLSHITVNDYKKFLSGLFPGFIGFIEKVHFDENAPENHNICITNLRLNYMFTYNKGNWLSKDKNETISLTKEEKTELNRLNKKIDQGKELTKKEKARRKLLDKKESQVIKSKAMQE